MYCGSRRGDGLCLLRSAVYAVVLVCGTPAFGAITVGGDAGQISPANPSTWTSSTFAMIGITSGKTGTLTIDGGSTVTDSQGEIGYNGGTGTVTVSGVGSTWTNGGDLYVGYTSRGTLGVAAGGRVTGNNTYVGNTSASTGTVTVGGSGSTWVNNGWLQIGFGGTGSLTIQDGGAVTTRDYGSIGGSIDGASTGSGTMTVTGAGSSWTTSRGLYVGSARTGSLTVEDGGNLSNNSTGYIGYTSGATGTVSVTGVGSTWTNAGDLYVHYAGGGTLTVGDGGLVTAQTLYAPASDLKGNGSINVHGLVADMDVVFDQTHGGQQAITFGTGGSLNLNADGTGALGAGYRGQGSIRFTDGRSVQSTDGYLGYNSGSSGTATVTGSGSSWNISGNLSVGNSGAGALTVQGGGHVGQSIAYVGRKAGSSGTVTVTGAGSSLASNSTLYVGYYGTATMTVGNGGQVSNGGSYVGYLAGSSGTVTVTGAGSTWNNSGLLIIGGATAPGVLTVSDGGKVTARGGVSIGSTSSLNLQVSGNDMLVLGSAGTNGNVANAGKIHLYADALLSPGTYHPISDLLGRTTTWSGAGSVDACGGIWDSSGKTFTVGAITAVSPGTVTGLTNGERMMVSDAGHTLVASFGAGVTGLSISATTMSQNELAGLGDLVSNASGGSVLAAWDFTLGGGSLSNPAMLAFAVGDGAAGLRVWHYGSSGWSAYNPSDLLYHDGVASFTVSGFSGYAVSGVVPEPSTVGLAGVVICSGLLRRQRHRDVHHGH